MRYVVVNLSSCSGKASQKWDQLKSLFSKDQIIYDFGKFDWEKFPFQKNDILISAGGDGTLHFLVNRLIQARGLDFLRDIRIGHIGLGSNNSYLRPYNESKKVNGIPCQISEIIDWQDLLQIEFTDIQGRPQKVYCIANASMGLLASANINFNQMKSVQALKKISSELADVYTFLATLAAWPGQRLAITIPTTRASQDQPAVREEKSITNLHFMKKPFYAADLGFPETIDSHNGLMSFNVLESLPKSQVFSRFVQIFLSKKYEQGRNHHSLQKQIEIESLEKTVDGQIKAVPLEADGEVYWSRNFKITAIHGVIGLCQ